MSDSGEHAGAKPLELTAAERDLARKSVDTLYRDADRAPPRSPERATLLTQAARMAALARSQRGNI